jgi:hypothetical protein
MGEEFYCILKLVSGEEILSLIMIDENDGDTVIVLQNPVTVKTITNQNGTFVKVKPWIELSSDDFFIVRPDKVITMTETKDKKIIDVYNDYIQNTSDSIEVYSPGGMVKPSSKMGYISSVEDARKKLEEIFKDIKES